MCPIYVLIIKVARFAVVPHEASLHTPGTVDTPVRWRAAPSFLPHVVIEVAEDGFSENGFAEG
jgi:hypothetical protein